MTNDFNVPPNDPNLELQVLGSIMFFEHAFDHIIGFFQPEAFYDSRNRIIFEIVQDLSNQGKPYDMIEITREATRLGKLEAIGGAYYLAELTNAATGVQSLEYKARMLTEMLVARSLLRQCLETINTINSGKKDIFDTLADHLMNSEKMIDKVTTGAPETMRELTVKTMQEIERMAQRKEFISGVPTGMSEIDETTGGWQKTDLIILAARPGMGKSAFAMTLAQNAAFRYGKSVMVFSLEMGKSQLMYRIYASEAGVPLSRIIRGHVDSEDTKKIHKAISYINESKMVIDDTSSISLYELKAKARTHKNKWGLDLVVIDYLQLMTLSTSTKGMNREQEISKISGGLKAMAKELDVPVIALSQLGRKVEERGNKIPMLSDLRESGAIEQDADLVTFLYRQDYYVKEGDPNYDPENDGKTKCILAKHRNGAQDEFPLHFHGDIMKFTQIKEDRQDYISPSHNPFTD